MFVLFFPGTFLSSGCFSQGDGGNPQGCRIEHPQHYILLLAQAPVVSSLWAPT